MHSFECQRSQRLRLQELASGYKLGKILSNLNLQPDFDQFDATGTPDAMINNFTRLQPTMKHLGIRMDARRANAIMCEQIGVAAQVIYDIRAVRKAFGSNFIANTAGQLTWPADNRCTCLLPAGHALFNHSVHRTVNRTLTVQRLLAETAQERGCRGPLL